MKKSQRVGTEEKLSFEDFIFHVSRDNEVEWHTESTFAVTSIEEDEADQTTWEYERGEDSDGWFVREIGGVVKMRTIQQWEELYPYTFRGW